MKDLNIFLKESEKNDLINETKNDNVENFPNVKELGNGKFKGALWGNCFFCMKEINIIQKKDC